VLRLNKVLCDTPTGKTHIYAHLLREYVYSMGYKTPSQFVTPIPLELVNIFG